MIFWKVGLYNGLSFWNFPPYCVPRVLMKYLNFNLIVVSYYEHTAVHHVLPRQNARLYLITHKQIWNKQSLEYTNKLKYFKGKNMFVYDYRAMCRHKIPILLPEFESILHIFWRVTLIKIARCLYWHNLRPRMDPMSVSDWNRRPVLLEAILSCLDTILVQSISGVPALPEDYWLP